MLVEQGGGVGVEELVGRVAHHVLEGRTHQFAEVLVGVGVAVAVVLAEDQGADVVEGSPEGVQLALGRTIVARHVAASHDNPLFARRTELKNLLFIP